MTTMLDQSASLGQAVVVRVDANRVLVERDDARMWAQNALPAGHVPAPGDSVLVIGQDPAWYVIGVLAAAGPTTLRAVGDFRVESLTGSVELSSTDGVNLQSTSINLAAERITTTASSITETCLEAFRWVKNALRVRAGTSTTIVDGVHRVKAQHVLTRADKEVKLDGESIHLG